MKNDIVDKLNLFLSENKKFNECMVVYFFVEIRKIIEHLCDGLSKEEKRGIYPIVRFYADWCLHTRKNFTDDFRDYLEVIVAEVEKDKNMSLIEFLSTQSRHGLAPLIELEELKNQLSSFLEKNNIDTHFLEDEDLWFSFRNSVGKILAEQPLVFEKDPIGNLRIREINFLTTNADIPCAFLISMKDVNGKEIGPFAFTDNDPNFSF
ncbi:MAG: hypothetical protein KGL39_02325 [Patescibacteria group bacterium]|nr:hypothetical protein [Patescibacteria group bacterium]